METPPRDATLHSTLAPGRGYSFGDCLGVWHEPQGYWIPSVWGKPSTNFLLPSLPLLSPHPAFLTIPVRPRKTRGTSLVLQCAGLAGFLAVRCAGSHEMLSTGKLGKGYTGTLFLQLLLNLKSFQSLRCLFFKTPSFKTLPEVILQQSCSGLVM